MKVIPVIACCNRDFERFRADRRDDGTEYRFAQDVRDICGYTEVIRLPIAHNFNDGHEELLRYLEANPRIRVSEPEVKP